LRGWRGDFGGGARPQGLVVEGLQWQHANRAATARVSMHVRKDLERNRSHPIACAATQVLASRTVSSRTVCCRMFCAQRAACSSHSKMYRSAHRVSWASRREHGKSNLLSAARLGPPALPQGCRQPFQRFRHSRGGPLKRFWVAPGTFHSHHSSRERKSRR
jgi:hypothetical protein